MAWDWMDTAIQEQDPEKYGSVVKGKVGYGPLPGAKKYFDRKTNQWVEKQHMAKVVTERASGIIFQSSGAEHHAGRVKTLTKDFAGLLTQQCAIVGSQPRYSIPRSMCFSGCAKNRGKPLKAYEGRFTVLIQPRQMIFPLIQRICILRVLREIKRNPAVP